MKKTLFILLGLMLLVGPRPAFADSLLDQIYMGFAGNAKFAIESNTTGGTTPEFLDNFVEIGNLYGGGHILALDIGLLGTILPDSQHFQSADWTTGGKLHLSPIIKNYVRLPSEWQFLGTLEIDARASYNWTQHHPFFGIVAAYPWK
jgi:hypothetical protein